MTEAFEKLVNHYACVTKYFYWSKFLTLYIPKSRVEKCLW